MYRPTVISEDQVVRRLLLMRNFPLATGSEASDSDINVPFQSMALSQLEEVPALRLS